MHRRHKYVIYFLLLKCENTRIVMTNSLRHSHSQNHSETIINGNNTTKPTQYMTRMHISEN